MPKNNYNYNFNPNRNQKKVSVNPWAMLIAMLVLTGLNVWASLYIGFDFFSIAAFVACGIGIFISIRNIIRSKKEK
ncbi:MAG: hypothetical protein IJ744_07770 [Lachnospiraceae bacterium]|nr:hypothetical protein [Lachnospiraceae bacterium]